MNTILLVEDDENNQLVIQDLFEIEHIDAHLQVVEDAETALKEAREVQPILILMDVRLPGMTGLEATKRLKEDPMTCQIPVWAITDIS